MMRATLKTWYERGYINYSLIPFVALGLVIAHQVYLNIPARDERPFFSVGGVSGGRVGDLSAVLSVDDGKGRVGDEFALEFALKNHGDADYVRRTGLPLFDLEVRDEDGVPVARWSDGRRMPKNLFLIHVPPGDEFTETKVWNLAVLDPDSGEMAPLGEGRYWLKGVWLGDPVIETGEIPLEIG